MTDKYIWIGSDAWTGQYLVGGVKHALGIQPKIEVIKEFDDYLNRYDGTIKKRIKMSRKAAKRNNSKFSSASFIR
jgi:hypothetical protein